MPPINLDLAARWLRVNGWERQWATANVWRHPTLSADAVSTADAIMLTMRADIDRATIPEAR